MKTEFDIQLFADFTDDDEQSSSVEVEESAEQVTDTDSDVEADTTVDSQADDEPIPQELEGLGESYARAAMKAWKEQQQQSEQTEQPAQEQVPQAPQVDELTQLRQERDQLRAQLQQFQNIPVKQPQAQSQPQVQPQIPQVKAPPIEWTKQNIEKFNEVVYAEAIRISGLTKDDIAGLEFRDDGDEIQERWKYAREYARGTILNNIRQAQERYVAEQTAFLQQHQASMQAYTEFAKS